MASEQELNRAKELLQIEKERNAIAQKQRDLDAESVGLATSLVDSIKELQGISTKRTTFDQNILKVNKQISNEIVGQKKGLSDLSTIQKQIKKNEDLIEKARRTSNALVSSLNNEDKERVKNSEKFISQISEQKQIQEDLLAAAERGININQEDLAKAQEAQELAEVSLEIELEKLSSLGKQAVFTKQNADELERQNEAREKEKDTINQINDSLGISGGLAKAFGKIPGLGDKSAKAFDKVQKKVKDIVDKKGIGAMPNRLQTAGMFAKELGTILMDAVTDPLTIMVAIGAAMLKNNKKITEFQRTMALSTKDAKEFAGNFSKISKTSDDINVNTANLVHNFMDMSEALGFMAKFSNDTLETATKLQYTLGISAESTANLAGAAEVAGGEFEDQYKNALAISYQAQKEVGVRVNMRKVLEETGKITGTIRANLGGNIENIAEAITKAKLFGSSLEEVANAGSKLLDFESSINAELEAELLLGRNLNLEKARTAALNGDQVSLMEELNAQMGSFSDFQDLNVIQQEALASAMGMSSDQLADILMQQEIQGRTAEELKALGKDELAAIVEKQNAQESFNAAVAQLKGLFVDAMKVLNPILEGFISLVKEAVKFKEIIFGVGVGIGTIYTVTKLTNKEFQKQIVLQTRNLAKSIANAAAFAVSNPVVALAGIAAGAAVYQFLKKGDDVFSPGQGGGGYGNRTLMGPEGAIALNNKDTVIAGTKLFNNNAPTTNSAPSIQMKRLEELQAQTNTLLGKIASTQGTVSLDAEKMGTAISMNTYEISP